MELFKTYCEINRIKISNEGNVLVNDEAYPVNYNKDGYKYIQVGDKYFSIHRMVAFMFVSRPNEEYNVVDHIDNNRGNNHYQNLRWTSKRLNGKNKKCKNKFGVNGIYEIDDKFRPNQKIFKVVIGNDNKPEVIGYFKSVNDAIEARIKREVELYGEYSKYYKPDETKSESKLESKTLL